ncbi:MAG: hypothetical protein K0V04_07260 [Deltaproteobacteria bacterium]|nr:hypothetical protein [Deltaproteobacteria bacterium]
MTAAAAAAVLGCGVTPDPEIADQFMERMKGAGKGWKPVKCPGRAAKIEALRDMVPLVHGLMARVRTFDAPLPPRLHEDVMGTSLLGRADDYRCVFQDFLRVDLDTEPNYQAAVAPAANLFMYKARYLLEDGEHEAGWAHVRDALALYRDPIGPGMGEHASLGNVLAAMRSMLELHPPRASMLAGLIEAVDATRVSAHVACAGLRHELLAQAVTGFRVHFDKREKTAMARRFGLDYAMLLWRSPLPGKLDRAVWNAFRDTYDHLISKCAAQPYGISARQAAHDLKLLQVLHPPTGVTMQVASDRLKRLGGLLDGQITMLATLHALDLRATLGRPPTTAELALSFGRRPRNPWDRESYTFAMAPGVVLIGRGSHRHQVILPRLPG